MDSFRPSKRHLQQASQWTDRSPLQCSHLCRAVKRSNTWHFAQLSSKKYSSRASGQPQLSNYCRPQCAQRWKNDSKAATGLRQRKKNLSNNRSKNLTAQIIYYVYNRNEDLMWFCYELNLCFPLIKVFLSWSLDVNIIPAEKHSDCSVFVMHSSQGSFVHLLSTCICLF